MIDSAGGLQAFLLRSPTFCAHEAVICLSEDVSVVAASISSRASSSSSCPSSAASSNTPTASNLVLKDSSVREQGSEPRSGQSVVSGSGGGPVSGVCADRPGSVCDAYSNGSTPSPRDSPVDSPHLQKKAATERTGKAAKRSRNKANKNNSSSSSGSGGRTTGVPVAVGSSRVDRITSEASILEEGPSPRPRTPAPTVAVHRAVQTEQRLMTDRWVMTDPVPVVESFKERYEIVLGEKIDLRAKLEESEDRRFKLQRDHRRELERLQKSVRQEAKEVCVEKGEEGEGGGEGGGEKEGGERCVLCVCVSVFLPRSRRVVSRSWRGRSRRRRRGSSRRRGTNRSSYVPSRRRSSHSMKRSKGQFSELKQQSANLPLDLPSPPTYAAPNLPCPPTFSPPPSIYFAPKLTLPPQLYCPPTYLAPQLSYPPNLPTPLTYSACLLTYPAPSTSPTP